MELIRNNKINRVLGLYTKLLNGLVIKKYEEANYYAVNQRSIQRDIDDIRNFLEINPDMGLTNTVVYDRSKNGYKLEEIYRSKLENSEILAICKILLDSRAFTKEEMYDILHKLVECCVPKENQRLVSDLLKNESFHYIEPRHKTLFTDKLWVLGEAIRNCNYIKIDYFRIKDKQVVTRKLRPVGIMFSEFYFYFVGYIGDEEIRADFEVVNDSFPTIYRIDRIKSLRVLNERFHIPYSSKFEEGEFRKRIQFMFGGEICRIKFKYKGPDIDAILDRLPTATIISHEDGVYVISAETFGKGIDMWIRSQGDLVEVISKK